MNQIEDNDVFMENSQCGQTSCIDEMKFYM